MNGLWHTLSATIHFYRINFGVSCVRFLFVLVSSSSAYSKQVTKPETYLVRTSHIYIDKKRLFNRNFIYWFCTILMWLLLFISIFLSFSFSIAFSVRILNSVHLLLLYSKLLNLQKKNINTLHFVNCVNAHQNGCEIKLIFNATSISCCAFYVGENNNEIYSKWKIKFTKSSMLRKKNNNCNRGKNHHLSILRTKKYIITLCWTHSLTCSAHMSDVYAKNNNNCNLMNL